MSELKRRERERGKERKIKVISTKRQQNKPVNKQKKEKREREKGKKELFRKLCLKLRELTIEELSLKYIGLVGRTFLTENITSK